MKCTFLLLIVLGTFGIIVASDSDEFQIQPNEALQFLFRARRTLFHPGKTKCEEQKREAQKAYEEKCTFLGKRYCPKLNTWKDFQQWEIGSGSKRDPLPIQSTTRSSVINMQTMRTHRTPLYMSSTSRMRNTGIYGPVAMRTTRRDPIYGSDDV